MPRSLGRLDERSLAEYVVTLLRGLYGRRLEPFFQATVTAVSGAAPAYVCSVRRPGESSDLPGAIAPLYHPAVGDVVECLWRDEVAVYVLWKLK